MQLIRIMSDIKIPHFIQQWQKNLDIQHYTICCECISPFHVCDDAFVQGHEFVGICTDHKRRKACLYHTRKLQLEDIIHELLHVKHPEWSEKLIDIRIYCWHRSITKGGDMHEIL